MLGGTSYVCLKILNRYCLYDEILIRKGEYKKIFRKIREDPKKLNKTELRECVKGAVAHNYRQLRMAYESDMMYPEAGDFYIGEMEMKRLKSRHKNFNLMNLYRIISLYGENYWLPLFWIFILIFVFSLVYATLTGISMSNMFSMFQISFLTFFQMPPTKMEVSQMQKIPLWIVGLERLTGAVITALFILALRRKFKKTEE